MWNGFRCSGLISWLAWLLRPDSSQWRQCFVRNVDSENPCLLVKQPRRPESVTSTLCKPQIPLVKCKFWSFDQRLFLVRIISFQTASSASCGLSASVMATATFDFHVFLFFDSSIWTARIARHPRSRGTQPSPRPWALHLLSGVLGV
jgi:hypothetical protein